MHIKRTFFSCAAILVVLWLTMPVNFAAANERLDQAQKLAADGNYRDALTPLTALFDDDALTGDEIAAAVQLLTANYLRLRQFDEAAAALEKIAEKHRQNWRYLFAVAQQYPRLPTAGTWFANEFHRNRGVNGEPRSAAARDRARVLQLCGAARELIEKDAAAEKTAFYLYYADRWLSPQAPQAQAQTQAWKLQLLTDLTTLPDYQTFDEIADFSATGAPVNADGSPLLYAVPPSFAAAKNDGERWRSILARLEEIDADAATAAALRLLDFSQSQFGLDSLRYFWRDGENADKFFDGIMALDQLSDNEYVARLASGISRFALPDDYAPQKLRRKIFASATDRRAAMAKQLADEYRERRQYENAVEWYEKLRPFDAPAAEREIAAITGKWAKFEPADGSPRLVFRNADKISFVLYRLKVEELLADTLDYLRQTPQPDQSKSDVNDIGRRLVYDGEKAYLGEKVAAWEMDLTPFAAAKKFADAAAAVNLPAALPAGGYLLVGKFAEGNAAARIVVWRDNTALVQKTLAGGVLHYVADANTGAPLAGMQLTAWGYARVWRDRNLERRFVEKTLTKTTGADGCAVFTAAEISAPNDDYYQWLVTATGDGRHAFYGFSGMWTSAYAPDAASAPRTFFITDRPVYRPNDAAQIKLWTREAGYAPVAPAAQSDPIDNSAGQKFTVKIIAPNGEVASEKEVTADRFGGATLTWQIPASAPLGRWTVATDYGAGSFRVEEYRKPEFAVTVAAPEKPVALGDKITATVKARYYFGEPVKNATVKYRVVRDVYRADWYPPHPWDWLYGNGFGWLAEDCAWLPGWRDWGCVRPPVGGWGRATPPELVAEAVAPLDENGELSVVIDTATAKLLHPDLDHRYRVTVEVTDASRRTIDGAGAVLVAKKPFVVTAWSDRGFYELSAAPMPVKLSFHAQTLDRQPVLGDGTLKISRLSYQNGVNETVIQEIALKPDAGGEAHFDFMPQEAGQYRAAYTLTTPEKIAQTGATVFTVRGDSSRSAASLDARFNPLEIVPEKAAYAVGEKCRLQINANQKDATVLLFLRGVDGVNLPPVLLRLSDRSAVYEFPLLASDQPNIFVEALAVSGGKVFNVVRSLAVPPQKKILNVALKPAATQLAPAAASQLTVRLTDLDGKPYRGQAALTIYDKSVEYIAGGSNVPDIKNYFWSWTRSHHGGFATSLNKPAYNLLKKGETPMTALSRFEETARDLDAARPRAMMLKNAGGDDLIMLEALPAPSSAAPMMLNASGGVADDAAADDAAAISDDDLSNVAARQNFADTAVWRGEILTDENGEATIDFVIPETLTTWQVRVWAMGDGTAVGQGETTVTTFKNLLVRLQTPRFLIAGDETTLSANIHNYAAATPVKTQIALAGNGLRLADDERAVIASALPADGEARADWRVVAAGEGESEITVRTLAADGANDAMLTRLPVLPAGIDKTVSFSGALRPSGETATLVFDVPADRRLNTTRLEFRYSPSLALAVIDALPYLAEYPYGCTEQTLNRFAPLVVAQTALKKIGVNLAAVKDKQTNLNAQELGDGRERAEQWAKNKRESFNPLTGEKIPFAPVFDEKLVGEMVEYGVKRLTAMQNADGGWGWFSGAGEQSFPHTTAVVLRGLIAARHGGALIPGNIIARGADWLRRYQAAQVAALSAYEKWLADGADKNKPAGKPLADNLDALIFMTLASEADAQTSNPSPLLSYLIRDRAQLSPYGKALFGLGLYYAANNAAPDSTTRADLNAELAAVMKNLSQFVVVDDENQTAYLDLGGENTWWRWYGSPIETLATYLQLLALTDAQNPLAPQLAKYLLNNRKHATRWNSTRDTALAVEALTTYLQTSGEMAPEMTVEISLDGKIRKTVAVKRDNLFTFDNTLTLTDRDLPTGKHQLTVRRRGAGAVYFNGYLSYFSTADHLDAAGLEIKATRKIYRLTPPTGATTTADARGNAATQATTRYDRIELRDGDAIKSGDLLEVELLLEAKNDYEYLIFTDHKLAGTEPVSSTSGYAGRGFGKRGATDDASFSSLPAYVEYRDATVNFFLRELPRGANTARYRVRAIYPGAYHALPTAGEAMYAPELRCNGESIKVKIGE
ncbi:MAG: alpha-2-macroglobulin [Planctomycetota bacterium]|jgi:uncharacterized protein YfaS (alpha-2-macroglobulin family)|nr:alpha-2-macroglobulin [Planctomycetota bacterium]